MSATPLMVVRLRRMTAENTEANYTDSELEERIEEEAIRDRFGKDPDDFDWTPTYNISKVASDIWGEKASMVSDEFDFNADGGSYSRSQKYQNALKQAAYYRSRSNALSLQMKQYPITSGLNQNGWEDLPYKDEYYDDED